MSIAEVHLISLDYKEIRVNGRISGVKDLHIGQGVNFLVGEKVRHI